MNKELEELIIKRQRWIDTSRENDFDEGIKNLLTLLYPDQAHFIYELLQNAEDAKAHTVRFTLSPERLVFEHDGVRLFTFANIESITNMGKSTKKDDPTNIGKFGVGFKAVYSYTASPEIHSGEFHIRITDLVLPEEIEASELASNYPTQFIFPFNNEKKSAAQAYQEISDALEKLDSMSLLFLENIEKIEYQVSSNNLQSIIRIDQGKNRIAIEHSESVTSHWLLYAKKVDVTDEEGNIKNCRISIAFSLERDLKKQNAEWQIVAPKSGGRVAIYFPAEKETSNLFFHLHAPFASTVARDSVRDCPANNALRDHLVDLVIDSLPKIRDSGLLTIDFLSLLPNKSDTLQDFYESFRKKIITAFILENLVPTRRGGHAPATILRKGGEIANIVGDDLALLDGSVGIEWVKNPSRKDSSREDQFFKQLGMVEWDAKKFIDVLTDTAKQNLIDDWISKKDDSWLAKLYEFLGADNNLRLIYKENFAHLHILRTQQNEHIQASDAYWVKDIRKLDESKNIIKFVLYEKNATNDDTDTKGLRFIIKIGVQEYNEETLIKKILETYQSDKVKSDEEHFADIRQFVKFWRNNKTTNIFKGKKFILREGKGPFSWYNPDDIYLAIPYLKNNLLSQIEKIHYKFPLSSKYATELNEQDLHDFIKFLEEYGSLHRLEVIKVGCWANPKRHELGVDKTGTRKTEHATDKDYTLQFLEKCLSYINDKKAVSASISKLIWNSLRQVEEVHLEAIYSPNNSKDARKAPSQLVQLLKDNAWIIAKDGQFYKPADMSEELLCEGFELNMLHKSLLIAIDFGATFKKQNDEYKEKEKIARAAGFDSVEELEKFLDRKKKNPNFLDEEEDDVPKNPERRERLTIEELNQSGYKYYEMRERSVRVEAGAVDAKVYLRARYTDPNTLVMACQICREEMPFKGKDKKYYFEAVEMLKKEFSKNHEAQYLALCPTCAARYKVFIKSDASERHKLWNYLQTIELRDQREISIKLDKDETIVFNKTHLLDLSVIIDYYKKHSTSEAPDDE